MRVVIGFPPNYVAIRHALGRPPETAIYCWEDAVYNPGRIFVTDQLLAHEAVHSAQQAKLGAENWWSVYLRSVEFRFGQELPAHVAEWLAFPDAERDAELEPIAARLASKLYGRMCSKMEARRLIGGALQGWRALRHDEERGATDGSAGNRTRSAERPGA